MQALCVGGDFDDCQRLAKQAPSDTELRRTLPLSSANSINLGRLLPAASGQDRHKPQPIPPPLSVGAA